MGLKNMSLLTGGSVSTTGGTALVFADDGITIQNGVHLVVPADTEYQTRRQCTAKYKPPTLDPKTGQYGKDKKSISYVHPVIRSDGSVVFATLRIEREIPPVMDADAAADMNIIGAQLLTAAAAAGFWVSGSTS